MKNVNIYSGFYTTCYKNENDTSTDIAKCCIKRCNNSLKLCNKYCSDDDNKKYKDCYGDCNIQYNICMDTCKLLPELNPRNNYYNDCGVKYGCSLKNNNYFELDKKCIEKQSENILKCCNDSCTPNNLINCKEHCKFMNDLTLSNNNVVNKDLNLDKNLNNLNKKLKTREDYYAILLWITWIFIIFFFILKI